MLRDWKNKVSSLAAFCLVLSIPSLLVWLAMQALNGNGPMPSAQAVRAGQVEHFRDAPSGDIHLNPDVDAASRIKSPAFYVYQDGALRYAISAGTPVVVIPDDFPNQGVVVVGRYTTTVGELRDSLRKGKK